MLTLTAHQLHVAYERAVALRDVTFSAKGSVVALIGHNGAGKSTLIKTLLGLLPISKGSITSFTASGQKLLPEHDMAFCPETGSVFGDISVESYLRLWCRIKLNDGAFYKSAGKEIIQLLDVEPLLPKLGRELSKGQRRRVQTAIGFLTRPRFFLFDEPFDGLDVQRTDELASIIKRFSGEISFMISSHRMDVIERISDSVIVLKDGQVAACGSVSEVCTTLSGSAVQIRGNLSTESLQQLEQLVPGALVQRVGEQTVLVGHGVELSQVKLALNGDCSQLSLSSSAPNLTEAMNYHLRNFSSL